VAQLHDVAGADLPQVEEVGTEALQERLTTWGLAPYLEVVVTRDDVPALKPAPDGIRHVLSQFRAVRQAYMIGDAWIDGQAARDVGVRFVGIGTKRAAIEARGIPIWAWVSDLPELLTLNFAG
jgi:phosphoglycolate phosphatase-like HAD superfamily hydrolase